MSVIKRLRASAIEEKPEARSALERLAAPVQPPTAPPVRLAPPITTLPNPAGAGPLVGECVDACHPTLQGRALVRWTDGSTTHEAWLPMLMSVTVRADDRVLLLSPANFAQPVIVGVLDGFASRPERGKQPAAQLELQNDEAIRVHSRDGQELLELSMSESGPVVKLLTTAVAISLPGALSISAESIALQARRGEVVVSATDDVVIAGATVRLN
jgi:hypothetical protein